MTEATIESKVEQLGSRVTALGADLETTAEELHREIKEVKPIPGISRAVARLEGKAE